MSAKMKYAMMSYTLMRRKDFKLEDMFPLTQRLGLEFIDIMPGLGASASELRKMADGSGVEVVCYTFGVDLNFDSKEGRAPGIEAARARFEEAKELGTGIVMIPTPPKAGLGHKASRANWIEGLKELAPIARDAGLVLTVENFPGKESPFVTAADFLEAQAQVPGLKLTFDNGNAAGGENPAESFELSAKHVVHAHFKDWVVDNVNGRMMRNGLRYSPALIGEGIVDHKATLRAMRDAGYSGCINIEYEGEAYPSEDAVRRAVEYLRSCERELA